MRIVITALCLTMQVWFTSANGTDIDVAVCGAFSNAKDRNACCQELGVPREKCKFNSSQSQTANRESIPKSTKPDVPSGYSSQLPQSTSEITAERLYSEFEKNGIAAEEKYKGKRITVAGKVIEVSKNIAGQPLVTLAADTLSYVSCRFTKEAISQLVKLNKNDMVRLSCKVDYKILTVIHLSDCFIN